MFVIFACFGCVVINHQKGGDYKENGPQVIWLNRFWCLMINITCGLMYLLVFVFVFVVHRMLKLLGPRHWGKQHLKTRHYEDQQVSSKVQETKNSVATTDCLAKSTGLSGGTPDCPVPHAGLSGALGNCSPTASSWWHWWREATGLSGVTSGLSGVKVCSTNGHLRCQSNG